MREYLFKYNDQYTLVELSKEDAESNPEQYIEVPSGANCAILGSENNIYFWKSNSFIGGSRVNWVDMGIGYDAEWYLKESKGSKLIWQRPTKPEELPFIDDETQQKHSHYFKDVSDVAQIDVYDVLLRFGVTDPCLQHIVKKALCAGNRGHKDFKLDLQDIADTAQRALIIHKV